MVFSIELITLTAFHEMIWNSIGDDATLIAKRMFFHSLKSPVLILSRISSHLKNGN